ncbi:MAG TPA: sigma-70 family RNA polymerase sigma factor, partial [Polyangiaceae bacterium]|nr:sigma-70 family RNA polymerase sigma factor [Polyangiaceae bacterium]
CRNVAQRVRARESRTVPLGPAECEFSAYLPDLERVSAGALMGCLGKLDARARSVVVLSFQAEKSAEEIAQVTEISAGNVRVVRHRAIAQLRRCLDTAEGARS